MACLEVRERRAAGGTVVLTTHYMEEAERLCDRVAIVDHGKVIALGTPAELILKVGGEHVIDFTLGPGPTPSDDDLLALASVRTVRTVGDGFTLTASEPHVALPALMAWLHRAGANLAGLTTRSATLEDVFVTLTGRHLRDDEEKP